MSPSPATGLSKGEREREINSTSFGECKTVPGMYLCLVMSSCGSLLLCGGGSLAGPYSKVSHAAAKRSLCRVLASSRLCWLGGDITFLSHSWLCMCSSLTGLWHSPLFPFLLTALAELFYHFCNTPQMVWFDPGWADWQVLPIFLLWTLVRPAWAQVRVQRCSEWLLKTTFHFQQSTTLRSSL